MADAAPKLSAILCVHNEGARLAACLSRLAFCDEMIVIADRCSDDTVAIAHSHGARVIEGAWEIEGERRNLGLGEATGTWCLEVDADEHIPPGLAAEICDVIARTNADYFHLPLDNYIGETCVRHGWGAYFGVTSVVRLTRKGCKSWGPQRVHPQIILTGRDGGHLTHRIAHYVDRDISDMIDRLNRYTSARARDLREQGVDESFARNFRRLFSRFYKCFVARKGYREGHMGVLVALMAGLYPLLSWYKARYDRDIL